MSHSRKSRMAICSLGFGLGVGFTLMISFVGIIQPSLAAELATIEQRGYLIVAVKDNLRPLGFRNQQGELEGLEIDLARRLAQELLGQEDAIQFRPVANRERLSVVTQGEVDLAIARVTVTNARSRIVDFSTPYYVDGTAVITRDPQIRNLSDLSNQSLAVLNGSSTISIVRSRLPSVRLIGVESYQAALATLESGEAAAFAADASVLSGWVQEHPGYHLLPVLLSAEALAVVMPRGLQYDDLRRRINSILEQLYEEGWVSDRVNYWGLP